MVGKKIGPSLDAVLLNSEGVSDVCLTDRATLDPGLSFQNSLGSICRVPSTYFFLVLGVVVVRLCSREYGEQIGIEMWRVG